jgi:hypothetical protein
MDSLEALADEQLWLLAEDIKLQLEKGVDKGTRPLLYLLAQQRKRAAAALIGIINTDANKADEIRRLQQEAKLYFDLMENVRAMLQAGREADRRIAENEREALSNALDDMDPEERRVLNIEPRGDD